MLNYLVNVTQSIYDKAETQVQCSFYYSGGLGLPSSHKRLGHSLITCHINEGTHLGLQRSHCRKNIPVTWFPPKPWSYYPTLLPFQGQEIPTAFSYQLIPKFCVSFSQFIPIRNKKCENFKKWEMQWIGEKNI